MCMVIRFQEAWAANDYSVQDCVDHEVYKIIGRHGAGMVTRGVIAADRLYALGFAGTLFCWDLSGSDSHSLVQRCCAVAARTSFDAYECCLCVVFSSCTVRCTARRAILLMFWLRCYREILMDTYSVTRVFCRCFFFPCLIGDALFLLTHHNPRKATLGCKALAYRRLLPATSICILLCGALYYLIAHFCSPQELHLSVWSE